MHLIHVICRSVDWLLQIVTEAISASMRNGHASTPDSDGNVFPFIGFEPDPNAQSLRLAQELSKGQSPSPDQDVGATATAPTGPVQAG
ncbi:MAG: hypothetical protein ABGY29_07375, partial [bacterium]